MSRHYDITFVGHMCFDEIVPFGGEPAVSAGSAVLCGAMAAAAAGGRVAAVVRMSPEDDAIVQPMRDAGIDVYVVPALETTFSRVIHPSADIDEREMVIVRDAGYFSIEDIPPIESACIHLAGISDREFRPAFIRALKGRGASLSSDMQSFVRQVDEASRRVLFADVPDKGEIVPLLDRVKLDAVEARIVTGEADAGRAAAIVASWGPREVVVTESGGVLALVGGVEYREAFSNRSSAGRTGRGDTTFGAYLRRRIDHDPAEALAFAAALVSLKMETPGPFTGTIEDVLRRMEIAHAAPAGRRAACLTTEGR